MLFVMNRAAEIAERSALTPTHSPQARGKGAHPPYRSSYSPSFFLRWPSVRSRSALSLMKPAASRWS
jgi:hypothetical protein